VTLGEQINRILCSTDSLSGMLGRILLIVDRAVKAAYAAGKKDAALRAVIEGDPEQEAKRAEWEARARVLARWLVRVSGEFVVGVSDTSGGDGHGEDWIRAAGDRVRVEREYEAKR
jgi:hypothetical protein